MGDRVIARDRIKQDVPTSASESVTERATAVTTFSEAIAVRSMDSFTDWVAVIIWNRGYILIATVNGLKLWEQ